VGSNRGDQVGGSGVTALSNGNYVVASPYWNGGITNGRGAVTWGDGGTGTSGIVSEANSLVGSKPRDQVGNASGGVSGITLLSNGNYVVASPFWTGGSPNGRGAVTWMSGTSGRTLDGLATITPQNSLVGIGSAIIQDPLVLDNPSEQAFVVTSN